MHRLCTTKDTLMHEIEGETASPIQVQMLKAQTKFAHFCQSSAVLSTVLALNVKIANTSLHDQSIHPVFGPWRS